jgi:hypothetical protein
LAEGLGEEEINSVLPASLHKQRARAAVPPGGLKLA